MAFVALKLLRLGYSQAKNHSSKNQQPQPQAQQPPAPYPNYQYAMPDYYPGGYPPGVAPGGTYQYPMAQPPMAPAPAPAPAAAAPPASKGSKLVSMFMSATRFLQFVFGLTVIGLYGQDVSYDHKTLHTWNAEWVFAVVTAFLATMTTVAHFVLPCCLRRIKTNTKPGLLLPQFSWELLLCILWLVLFGLFGKMYIGVYPAGEHTVSGSGSNSTLPSASNSNSTASVSGSNSNSNNTLSSIAIKRDTASGLGDAAKIDRMRHAVWVDLLNLVFWCLTASWILLRYLKARRAAKMAWNESGQAEKGDAAST
ncbi:hypothetical protein N7474_001700 [Penicillium riverlandense]|uniref:uncharacterized protein n=1 Tax=Penicillium riverlandense TaxID=1903569 RepID=UPI00254792BA|nr:uncharacterized protein N7474_001700 [Penicillium riverlandense]KAJ5833389.1 hypothetical protein N7474_001700 [Penicillium riverlandense]